MAKKDIKVFLKDNKFTVASDVIGEYKTHLQDYLQDINIAIQKNESEEHLKGILKDFLRDSLYFENKYTINTSSSIDAAISKDNKLQVLIETKKPQNTNEMISEANLNKKALWEIILYYIEATRSIQDGKAKRNPDSEIKNLVITDCKKFFVFDSHKVEYIVKGELEEYWEKWKNNHLISSNKDIFYAKAKEFFENEENISKLDYVYFNIEELSNSRAGIISSYKILSRQALLKENVNKIVASPLNSAFYQELLYILGLKEVKEQGKTLIKINFDVENTFAVQVYKYLRDDKGLLDENEIIDKTFSSIIVWTNRLLFIKLFEGQLLAINGDKQEYRILDKDKIEDENDLQSLFFKILGTKDRENGEFFDKFKDVPYLNSSLFELYDVEKNYIRIRDIDNNEVVVKPHSKTKKQGKLKLVEYIIDFLNSYNFSSVSVGESETTSGEEIIDAAVLGLIFEKINGYKDGSYYTPSSITEYICKETIESAVIQKVNEFYGVQLKDFDELIYFVSNSDLSKKKQINEIINNLKICDPAVGSGHFLVSALNRIIAIKSELGVLFYHNENKLLNEYEIRVVNDILTIIDGNGEPFKYNREKTNLFKVQKTIFCEKRQIIENCLFGVDINDKAVSICQLRLWIELLKNAYYENNVMETLPNIDINIKCGNSLVHKLPVEVGKKLSGRADKELRKLIAEYKLRVNNYKQESNKVNKQQIKNAISTMKGILHQSSVQITMDFYGDTTDYAEIELMKTAFEWAIEFPEVLSEDGTFLGFDCVIGNPPYVSALDNSKENAKTRGQLRKLFPQLQGAFDLYVAFLCFGVKATKAKGFFSWIIPNKFLVAKYAKEALSYLIKNGLFSAINISHINVFENAGVYPIIICGNKQKSDSFTQYKVETLADLTQKKLTIVERVKGGSTFKDKGVKFSSGTTGFQAKQIINYISEEERVDAIPFVVSGCVDRYELQKDNVRYMGKRYCKPNIIHGAGLADSKWDFWLNEKIVIAGMTKKIEAIYCKTPLALGVGVYAIYDYSRYNPKALTAILNSKYLTYYLTKNFSEKHLAGGYLAINKETLEQLPLVDMDREIQLELAQLHDRRVVGEKVDKLIDEIVYRLYNLTPEEIVLVEESVK